MSDRKESNARSLGGASKVQLEKRLANLLQPNVNAAGDQLAFLDDFLCERNSKDVLRSTVDFVKPFFLSVVREQLESEASQLLE